MPAPFVQAGPKTRVWCPDQPNPSPKANPNPNLSHTPSRGSRSARGRHGLSCHTYCMKYRYYSELYVHI